MGFLGWCPPCRAFSPDFVKYVNETMPKHPELAVIFLNDDKQVNEMLAYMQQEKMPFPATNMKDWNQNSLLTSYSPQLILQLLVIVDRFGKLPAPPATTTKAASPGSEGYAGGC